MIISTELEIGRCIGRSRIDGKRMVKIDVIEISDISETKYETLLITDMETNFLSYIKNLYFNLYNNTITIKTAQELFKQEYDKNYL